MALAVFLLSSVATHAGSPPSAAALALVMACQSVSTSESAPAFRANVWPLSSMELGMSLQIVQSAEAGLACLADVGLFLAVGEQVALEVVMSCEFSRAVRAPMFFR